MDNGKLLNTLFDDRYHMLEVIGVGGMMCSHCTAAVEKACKAVPGTASAVADLDKKQVTVRSSGALDALEQAIIDAGYTIRR